MIRIKQYGLFIVIILSIALLLVISCNQGRSAKSSDTDVGKGVGVKQDPTKGDDNEDLKVKIDERLLKFRLSDKEVQIIRKIQEIVTNPDIGKAEGYSTYNDLKFYTFLGSLDDFKIREIIRDYLKVYEHYEDGKKVFSQFMNDSALDGPLKKRLQSELDAYNYNYLFRLKQFFGHVNPSAVYGVVTKGYIKEAISKIDEHLSKVRRMVAEGSGGTKGAGGSAGAEVPANSEVIKEPTVPASSQATRVDENAPVTEPAEGTLGAGGSAGAEVPANSEVIKEPTVPASSQATRVDENAPVTEPAEGTLGTDGSAGAEVPANSEVIKEPAIPASSQVTRVDRDAPVTEPAEGTLGTDGSAGGVEEVNVSLAGTVGVDDARDPAGPKYIGDSTDVVVTEYIGGPAGFGSIHLKLEAEEIEGIGELRKLVTSPSQDYKTYNDSEFDGLISDLGVLKAKKIAIAYNAYAAERKRLQEELDAKINDVEISPKLQAELDDAKKRAEFAIRSAFTKFNGDGTALDVIPDPNRVYASMLYLNSEYFFARFKEYLANSVKYKEMEGELTESQKGTFRYINDKMTDPKFCIYFLLGILNVTQLKEIANLHSRIIEAQDAASKALAEALDVKGKKDCETRFSLELLDYHNYLNASKYKRANPKQFYDHMVKGEHVNSFIDSFRGIEYQASNLPRKRKYVITQVLP
ncbi:BTA121 domain-containing protein surface lipoprotein [Borrelia coriaceae]|nr:hypothetical protein [Borrelia coriaceae]